MSTFIKLFRYNRFSLKNWFTSFYIIKGLNRFEKGDSATAVNIILKAITIQPLNSWAHYSLGYVYQNLGQFKEAAKEYGEALNIDPVYRGARIGIMEIMEKEVDEKKIKNFLREQIKLEPLEVNYRIALGRILYGNANIGEAISVLEEALKVAPNDLLIKEHLVAYKKPL